MARMVMSWKLMVLMVLMVLSVTVVMGKTLYSVSAKLDTFQDEIQTASCNDDDSLVVGSSVLKGNSTLAAIAKPGHERNPKYQENLATKSIRQGLAIMQPKSYWDLYSSDTSCKYDFGEGHTIRTAKLKSWPARKLEWRLPVDGVDEARLANSSVQIDIEADEKWYVFDSRTQKINSMEVYLQSVEEDAGVDSPPILFVWRKPTRRKVFSLTVYVASGSDLDLNADRYSCRLRLGWDFLNCSPPRAADNCENNYVVIAVLSVILSVILVVLVVIVVRHYRLHRRCFNEYHRPEGQTRNEEAGTVKDVDVNENLRKE